jgi:hypothetical protein
VFAYHVTAPEETFHGLTLNKTRIAALLIRRCMADIKCRKNVVEWCLISHYKIYTNSNIREYKQRINYTQDVIKSRMNSEKILAISEIRILLNAKQNNFKQEAVFSKYRLGIKMK